MFPLFKDYFSTFWKGGRIWRCSYPLKLSKFEIKLNCVLYFATKTEECFKRCFLITNLVLHFFCVQQKLHVWFLIMVVLCCDHLGFILMHAHLCIVASMIFWINRWAIQNSFVSKLRGWILFSHQLSSNFEYFLILPSVADFYDRCNFKRNLSHIQR